MAILFFLLCFVCMFVLLWLLFMHMSVLHVCVCVCVSLFSLVVFALSAHTVSILGVLASVQILGTLA